jgi:hypothetical protein
MVSNFVKRKTGICSGVLLLAGMLLVTAERPGLAQTSNTGSTTLPTSTGHADAPNSTATNGSGGEDPVNSPVNPPAGGHDQPFAVNPVTGLTSTSAANYRPLTRKDRWNLYWKQNYASTGAYFGPVITALVLDQASNSPQAWGGGLEGYGRRLGSRMGTSITQGTFQAALAAALHEDVRYISSAAKGFKRRSLHAIAFSFVTYNNSGHITLNIANLTSYYGATAISTTWVPITGSRARYTLTNGTEQIVLSLPINFLQEFWPEIQHKVFRHR